jgi:hypothetical protein
MRSQCASHSEAGFRRLVCSGPTGLPTTQRLLEELGFGAMNRPLARDPSAMSTAVENWTVTALEM